jgi:gluconolactonase
MKQFLVVALAAGSLAGLAGCSSNPEAADTNGATNAMTAETEKPAVAAEGTSIARMDPALDAVIPKDAVLEKIADGFGFTEGPVWVGDRIRFSDLTGNKLYEITPDGEKKVLLDKSGGLDAPAPGSFTGSNGSAVDKDGTVLMAQHGMRRVVRVDDQMKITPVIDKIDGKRLNSPNDIVFASDGALWITDPPYGLAGQDKDKAKEAPNNAVYRYKDGVLKAVITDLPRPNGIGFSPDGKKLYVSNSEPKMFINVYDVNADGTVSNGKTFISYPGPNPSDVPDGLKVDSQGNVWASGPGGIRIISPAGKVLGQLKSPDKAQANLAWGGADWKTAYIMGAGSVYRLKLAIPGEKPLYTK